MSLTPPITSPANRRVGAAQNTRRRWLVRLLLWPVLLVWCLLMLAWLALHWVILPHIQDWRAPIEARASATLGVAVQIGAIQVISRGWVPALELRDVKLLDAQNRAALQLPRVAVTLAPQSLLDLRINFEQLLIEGAELDVRRDAAGRITVAGLDLSGGGADDRSGADWFFSQHEFVIRGATLRWTDEQRDAPPLALTGVELVMRNGLLHHDVRLDATPPAEWGERFSARGRFTQPLFAGAGEWQRWSGRGYIDLPRADLHQLRRYASLPFDLSEGLGALRGWFELRDGQPIAATVDLALNQVVLRLAPSVDPLRIEQLRGRVEGRRDAQGVSVSVQGFSFATGDGVRWPSGDAKLVWRQKEGEPVSGGEVNAQRLDLALMAQVASRIPMGAALRQLLVELKPQGAISDVTALWEGPLDAPRRYQVKGQLNGLSLAARAASDAQRIGRPGLRNASLQLNATETGGTAKLAVQGGMIEVPGVFADPRVPLDRLSAELQWSIGAGKVTVRVKNASFSNPDMQGDFDATWNTGPGGSFARAGRLPGQIDVTGQLRDGLATRVARYLPLGIPEAARTYVERSVKGGRVRRVDLRIKGDLWDFPYFDANFPGELRVTALADDVSYAFVPSLPATPTEPAFVSPWPTLTRIGGELVVDRSSLSFRNVQAQLGGVAWSQVQGGIRDLVDERKLNFEGNARGSAAEMLRIVNASPVGGWIHGSLARTTASGTAELKLGLALPLRDLEHTEVTGSVQLPGNDVRIVPDSPLLAGARGRVDFSHKGFAVVGATANAYGGELGFDGGTQGDGGLRFGGRGTATAEAIRRAPELGLLARVAPMLSGQVGYRISLAFVQGHPELSITSDLVGLASDLPVPMRKAAETPLAMHYQTRIKRESLQAGQTLADTLQLNLGSLLQVQYQRDLSGDTPRVMRGGIGLNEAAPAPTRGVVVSASLPLVSLDAWEPVYAKVIDADSEPGDAADDPGYGPERIALRAKELITGGRRVTGVVAGLSKDKSQWKVNLDADQLNGYIEYRSPGRGVTAAAGGAGSGRIYARLSRLTLPKSDVDLVESLLNEPPTSAPALDVVIDDFELRGKRLGRLELMAVNRPGDDPRVREWQLSKFTLSTPEAQLGATGTWSARGAAARRAEMDFKLELRDSGAFLERLGMGKAVRGGKGVLAGQVAWLGSPLTLDFASMSGQVKVNVEAGQFLKADPGAARLLGVLSLQALPRRLLFDFRDVFEEGFAFDSFSGDLRIAQGVAHTTNLRMRGVQAVVLMEGQADIGRETQDLRVVVVPEINAGTASLAYAVINPAIGLGTFLAQLFLRRPLSEAGTRQFHVSGPWGDPQVEAIVRKNDPALTGEPRVEPATAPVPTSGATAAPAGAPPGKSNRASTGAAVALPAEPAASHQAQ